MTGNRGVSLPFTDYCTPFISHNIQFQDVFDSLAEYGKKAHWKYIEIREGNNYFEDLNPSSYYYGHTLSLCHNEKDVFSHFRDSNKRNIKKAMREGVEVNIYSSLESIKEFYQLNCLTRKMHGLPPQPFYFFKKIYEKKKKF